MLSLLLRAMVGSCLGILFSGCDSASGPVHRPLWEIGEKQELIRVGFDGKSLITAFDRAQDRPRLLMILSPT